MITRYLVSFFLGGFIIALQSILAERYPKIGGYIISLPSTLPLSLFFIGWIHGIDNAKEANYAVPFSIIVLILFTFIFYFLAKRFKDQLVLINVMSLLSWFILSAFVNYFFSEITFIYSIIYCFVFLTTGAIVINILVKSDDKVLIRDESYKMKLVYRSIIAGSIVVVPAILVNFSSPFLGGIFAVFPAAYISNFNFILKAKGFEVLKTVVKKIPEGAVLFLLFSIIFWLVEFNSNYTQILITYLITALIGVPLIVGIHFIRSMIAK